MKLGDVAINSTAATKDYESAGYTRYIIGKHIPEDGRVTTWNPVGDAEFGSRIRTMVQAGDVICTTRGPKLRVAVADFDCLSAHTNFILRPKDATTFLPGILQAVVRSDGFQDHLRKHFRGSTNLFVNWSDAARYEFALPCLEEQRRLVAAQSAVEEVLRSLWNAQRSANNMSRRLLEAFDIAKLPFVAVEELVIDKPQNGVSPQCNDQRQGRPTLPVGCVYTGIVNTRSELKYSEIDDDTFERFRLRGDDILVVRGNGNRELVGRAGIVSEKLSECFYPDLLIRLRFDATKLEPVLAVHLWNCVPVHADLIRRAKSTNGIFKINGADIRAHRLPVPPKTVQAAMLDAVATHAQALLSLTKRVAAIGQLRSNLLNSLTGSE